MIAVLLIIVPLLAGLAAFFFRNEKTARAWALVAALVTLAVSLLGISLLKEEKYLV
jgi:NADH-quinone oxidoreductase subunit M